VRLTVVSLFAGLAVGIAAGLAWYEPPPPRRALVERMEAAVTRHSSRADRPALRTHCTPVRGSDTEYSCFVVQHRSKLGNDVGIYYEARVDWRTREFRFARFDVPLYWGV
jgi:hypothetical protein